MRKWISVLILFILSFNIFAEQLIDRTKLKSKISSEKRDQSKELINLKNKIQAFKKKHKRNPKIGLVLSGGGGKGFAHIGVLKVLEKNNIKIDYLAGNSVGAIIASFYSLGYSANELEKIVTENDIISLFAEKISRNEMQWEEKKFNDKFFISASFDKEGFKLPKGLLTGRNVYEFLKKYTWGSYKYKSFDDFPIPLRIVATDLHTGKIKEFSKGDLAKIINASMAVPGLFHPVKIDGRLYIDGLVARNFPVQNVIDMGADIVIGVNIGAPLFDADKLDFLGIVNQISMFNGVDATNQQKKHVDILIEPDVLHIPSTDYTKMKELIELGEKSALNKIKALQLVAKKEQVELIKRDIDNNAEVDIHSVEINGLNSVDLNLLLGMFEKDTLPYKFNREKLQETINLTYTTDYFDRIYYSVEGDKLKIDVNERAFNIVNLGLNLSNYSGVMETSIRLGTSIKSFTKSGNRLMADLKISRSPALTVRNFLYYGYTPFIKAGLTVEGHVSRTQNIFYDKDGSDFLFYSDKYYIDAFLGTITGKDSQFGVGLRKEWSYTSEEYETNSDFKSLNDNLLLLYADITWDSYDTAAFPKTGAYFNARLEKELLNDDAKFSSGILSFDKKFKINDKLTFMGGIHILGVEGENIPMLYHFNIGGATNNDRNYEFYGMHPKRIIARSAGITSFGIQYELFDSFYLFAKTNNVSYQEYDYVVEGSEEQFTNKSGYGVGIGYDSFIGPMELIITNDAMNKDDIILLFNIGKRF